MSEDTVVNTTVTWLEPEWAELRLRKIQAKLHHCHHDIHAGRATATTRNEHWRAVCAEKAPVPFGKGPTEKDPE